MLEDKPPFQDSAASLQTMSWSDLSARLFRARDLRRVVGEDENAEGSFDAASARWIADHSPEHTASKPDVNPDRLAHGKLAGLMAGVEHVRLTPSARLGDRGK